LVQPIDNWLTVVIAPGSTKIWTEKRKIAGWVGNIDRERE
jgi:hypothetical protein